MSRLADPRLGRAVSGLASRAAPAIGAAGRGIMPSAAADTCDPSQEQLNKDRNQAARTFPSWARGGAVEDAYQMAQVPERGPERVDEFGTARSLPAPTGGPMPTGDDGDEFASLEQAAAEDPEIAEMIKTIILARVQEAQMGQIPNAMASHGIASRPSMMAATLRNFAQQR